MRVARKLLIEALCIISAFAIAFAWIKIQASVGGMTVAMVGGNDLLVGKTVNGAFGNTLDLDSDYEIGCATSTNGYKFYDEDGQETSDYAEFSFYVKSPVKRGVYAKVVTDCESEALRVSVTWNTKTTIFTPTEFGQEISLDSNATSLASEMVVRFWFDGATATELVATSDISLVLIGADSAF